MRHALRFMLLSLALAFAPLAAQAADKVHRVAIQVDVNDPAVMNLALNNASNMASQYASAGEKVEIEIVTYGPGLNMLRDDTSPVKARVTAMKQSIPTLSFVACAVTKRGMEKTEGHEITIVPEATVVPSGAIRLVELQEQGWSYLKP
jgi:intracellular sulfur oxidation DsrE/DsrF family protein